MANVRVSREQMVEESVNLYIKAALVGRGFGSNYQMIESYPYGVTKLDNNLIACGFEFDDGGKAFELGSNMKERKYTTEFFVFGMTLTWAKSLANAIKFGIEQDLVLPLVDPTQAGNPQIDILYVDLVHSRRQVIADPEPWQEFTYMVNCVLCDYYTPSLT